MSVRNRLTFTFIRNAPAGKYNDGSGLWFHKRKDGGAQWFLRVSISGHRREMGLGGYPDVSLKDAREAAERWRLEAKKGTDPLQVRNRERNNPARTSHTLSQISEDAFEARKAELRQDGKAGRWFTPIKLHILPRLGDVPIEQINQTDIKNTLAPIWHSKADTARKAMNRLNLIFQYAVAAGIDVDISAVAKAKVLLGKTRHRAKHISAVHWSAVPKFYSSLAEPTPVNLALRLLILTGVRSKPLRFIRLEQIENKVWIVPAVNMKGRKDSAVDFHIPLSSEALNVISQLIPFERDGYLLPSTRKGVMSDATMARMMERRQMKERPHGFRSSLRTWLADCTEAPHEVCETILAHTNGTSLHKSYRRTDYLSQRAILMERWAEFVCGKNNIIELANV